MAISTYRPQLYTPKYLSQYNRQAVKNLEASIAAAADLFATQLTDNGSSMVELTIRIATERVQKQAQAKIAAAQAGVDKTV